MTLLLALFVTASAWAQLVMIYDPNNNIPVYFGRDPDALTTNTIMDALAGETIYFTFNPGTDYQFEQFNFVDCDEIPITESDGLYSFTVPDYGDGFLFIQIQVVFEYIAEPPVVEGVDINAENFPDENFRNWLLSQTYGADAVITDQEMAGITKIVARGLQIQDLTGIQYFTQLTELDISNNPETMSEESWNVIETIDLSSNTSLRKLYCDYNKLYSLILFANTELRELSCSNNQLGSIDLSPSENLQKLTCSNNQIGSLDLTGFPNLSGLWCNGNQLTILNISSNLILELFQCENNQLEEISGLQDHSILRLFNCNDNLLTSLDVTGCPELYQLYCWNNQIKSDDMELLMNSLPERSGYCVVLDLREGAPEQNEITNEQVAIGKAKGWSVEGKTGDGDDPSDYVQLGNTNEHEYVNLGLPSGTLWATTNVGATSPHDIGLFFAWGETEGHGADVSDDYLFDWDSYKWAEVVGEDSYLTKYCVDSKRGLDGFSDLKYVLDLEDDAATANWGEEWRTPSLTQFKELQQYCTWEPDEVHGVPGYRVTGDNGNSIFLPETGWRIDELYNPGGAYWARDAKPDGDGGACQFAWDDWGSYEYGGRCNGQCVRPVVNKSIKTKYYLIGKFNNWNEEEMVPFGDNDCTSLTMTLSGEFLVKDTIGNWWGGDTIDVKYTLTGNSPSVELATGDSKKNLNLVFPTTYMFSILDGKLTVFGFPAEGFYLTGDFNDWTPEAMTDNGDGIYTLQKVLLAGQQFKFRDHKGNFYGGDTQGQGDTYGIHSAWCTNIPLTEGDAGSNFIINTEGAYTFTVTQTESSLKLDVTGFGSVTLTDNADNTEAITYAAGIEEGSFDAILSGRTLYKDGGWNTLCLPFMVDLTDESCPLAGDGVEARELEDANFVNGTLTLTFSDPVEMLSAGVPYIIKWDNAEEDIIEPTFYGTSQWSSMLQPVEFEGVITFTGTYSPVEISALGDDTKLFIGADNSVFYPNAAMTIGCQRAYFQLADGITAGDPDNSSTPIKAFELNFGEENGISLINTTTPEGCWFSIDGLRHSTMPTQRGIYIQNGRKFFVK